MGRQRGHAHRHDRPFARRQRPHRAEELIRPAAIHDAQDRAAALGQPQGPLAPVLGFLLPLHEATPDEPVDEPARGRRGPPDLVRQFAHRHRAAIGEDIQGRELGEAEAELAELPGEPDDQLAPEGPAHRDALAELADVLQPAAGREDRGREVRFEARARARAGAGRRGARVIGRCSDTSEA